MRHRPCPPAGRRVGFLLWRLHHKLFFWFGAAILMTGLAVVAVMHLIGGRAPWQREVERGTAFVGHELARAWDDPGARQALVSNVAHDLDARVVVYDTEHTRIASADAAPERTCRGPRVRVPVARDGASLGSAEICFLQRGQPGDALRLALGLLAAGAVLWAASGAIARRLSRPLWELVRVTEDIGRGKLSSRVQLRARRSEFGAIGLAVNEMADRIERQLAEQRELLAAVSHEIRTPLARIRLLVEMARDGRVDDKLYDELDREVVEIDELVGELLASSRLEFSALSVRRIDAAEAARRALDRAGIGAAVLDVDRRVGSIAADATLLARALANLLDNARKHGGGVVALRVAARDGAVAFEVDDDGEGFPAGDEEKAFDPFYGRARGDQASLGLGLALVRRIAEAHGGRAYAENRREGGARVGIELSVEGPSSGASSAGARDGRAG